MYILFCKLSTTFMCMDFDCCDNMCDMMFTCFYQNQVGEKTRIKWFVDDNSDKGDMNPFSQRKRNIVRHPYNSRQQQSVKSAYVASVKTRGVVEGVRGECWVVSPNPSDSIGGHTNPFMAISFGSLSEAFYTALNEDGDNPNLLASLRRGLEARVLHNRTPPEVLRFLIHIHNSFHSGSGTSFCELIGMVPQVS